MSEYIEKFLDWVSKQLAYAKSAWAVAVIVAGILGYNLTLEKKDVEPEPEPETPVEDVTPVNPNPRIPVN